MKGWTTAALLIVASATCRSVSGQGFFYPPTRARATTVEGSILQGMSDVIMAGGEANLRNSEAAINYEEARSKNFDNRLKYTQMYFERKKMNREYRAAYARPRPSSETLFRLAKTKLPKRLTPSELDPLTGRIIWPKLVKNPTFDDQRKAVDKIFEERAKGTVTADSYPDGRRALANLQGAMQKNIRSFPPQQFSVASTFIKRLEYELRF